MKLKIFSEETMPKHPPKKPVVTIGRKGSITFPKEVSRILGIEIGSRIAFAQEENTKEIFVMKSPKGFPVRKLGQAIGICNAKLISALGITFNDGQKSIHLEAQEKPINYDGTDMLLLTIPKLK